MRSESIYQQIIIEKAGAPSTSSFGWIGLIVPALLAAVMVAIGWYVVEKYARQREKRSDLRSAVASFSHAVGEVREAAFVFYRLHGNDPQAARLAATIRSKVSSLADQLAIMKSAGIEIESDELLKRFRQAVTGGEFDSTARQPLSENSSAFLMMSAAAESLSREVHVAMLRVLLGEIKKSRKIILNRRERMPLSQPINQG